MCKFEKMIYTCGHFTFRRFAYCHFARNDLLKQCNGVQALKREWPMNKECDECVESREAWAEYHRQQQQDQQQQGQQQRGQQQQGQGEDHEMRY
jgi:hypothetical protein